MQGYRKALSFGLASICLVLVLSVGISEAKCRRCCEGKDNTCRAYGARLNRRNATTCFCDSDCTILGDCCLNYKQICHPVDCVLEEKFDEWEECSESCGWGYKTRTRAIRQKPQNGGKKCGQTEQKTYCLGQKCKGRRASQNVLQEVGETAKVIPAQFGTWRKNKLYNPYSDIRSNLFHHYAKDTLVSRPSYCAEFEVVETRKACQSPLSGNWAKGLQKGSKVCVECQPSAMKKTLGVRCKGHGVYLRQTRWNAVTVPGCHGKWEMVSQRHDCSCDPKDTSSFIFI